MENKNIVLLKRHFVNYKPENLKTTAVYVNQCPNLQDYEMIDVTSHNRDSEFKSQISPMFVGPCIAPDGAVAQCLEELWQAAKVYPCFVKDGEPTAEYFEWRNKWYSYPKPGLNSKKEIKLLRHLNEELGAEHSQTLYTCWYNTETKKYDHLAYVEARKRVYFPEYAKVVYNSPAFKELKKKVDSGAKVVLMDYDCFNYYYGREKERAYQRYLNDCKKNNIPTHGTLNDFMNINSIKDLVDCPYARVGHGVALKALLQGDLEVVDGKVIDHSGILE